MRNKLVFALGAFLLAAAPAMAEAVKTGNAVCPVSGDKISGKHFVEYQGKKIALCCSHCAKDFKKDPEKYMARLKEGKAHKHDGHDHSR